MLKPRERLVEDDLLHRYNTSRFVIRNAFKHLEFQGLIKYYRNKVAAVSDLSEGEAVNIYSLRILLENFAFDLIKGRVNEAILIALKGHNTDFEEAVKTQNFKLLLTSNEKFHECVFRACGNPILSETINCMRTRANLLSHYYWRLPGQIEKSLSEHKIIIRCMSTWDSVELKRINKEHVLASLEAYLGKSSGL